MPENICWWNCLIYNKYDLLHVKKTCLVTVYHWSSWDLVVPIQYLFQSEQFSSLMSAVMSVVLLIMKTDLELLLFVALI